MTTDQEENILFKKMPTINAGQCYFNYDTNWDPDSYYYKAQCNKQDGVHLKFYSDSDCLTELTAQSAGIYSSTSFDIPGIHTFDIPESIGPMGGNDFVVTCDAAPTNGA